MPEERMRVVAADVDPGKQRYGHVAGRRADAPDIRVVPRSLVSSFASRASIVQTSTPRTPLSRSFLQ